MFKKMDWSRSKKLTANYQTVGTDFRLYPLFPPALDLYRPALILEQKKTYYPAVRDNLRCVSKLYILLRTIIKQVLYCTATALPETFNFKFVKNNFLGTPGNLHFIWIGNGPNDARLEQIQFVILQYST